MGLLGLPAAAGPASGMSFLEPLPANQLVKPQPFLPPCCLASAARLALWGVSLVRG